MAASANTQQRANWIVRFYTRARKVPTLIGKLPDGSPIPFGPYTGLQLIASVGTLIVLFKTRELWGFAGGLVDLLLAVAIAFAVGKIAGRFESGFHNPVVLATGAMASLTQPRHGTSGGRPVRMPRTVRATGRIVVQARATPLTAPASSTVQQKAQPTSQLQSASYPRPAGEVKAKSQSAVAVAAVTEPKTSDAVAEATNRLTGVQALLAQSGTRRT